MMIIGNRYLEYGAIPNISDVVSEVKIVTVYVTENGMEAHVVKTDGSIDFIPLVEGQTLCMVE